MIDKFQYSFKFQVLTDVSVVHAPSWLNMSTRSHSPQFMICLSVDACQLDRCLSYSISLRRL